MQDIISTFQEAKRLYAKGNFGRTIDGSSSSLSRCCGFCTYSEHTGFLTENQRRSHNCLGNSCSFYLPKISDACPKTKIHIEKEDFSLKLNEALKSHEGMKVLRARKNFQGTVEADYTAISNYDEAVLEKEVMAKLGLKVKFNRLPYSFSNAAEIIFKGK